MLHRQSFLALVGSGVGAGMLAGCGAGSGGAGLSLTPAAHLLDRHDNIQTIHVGRSTLTIYSEPGVVRAVSTNGSGGQSTVTSTLDPNTGYLVITPTGLPPLVLTAQTYPVGVGITAWGGLVTPTSAQTAAYTIGSNQGSFTSPPAYTTGTMVLNGATAKQSCNCGGLHGGPVYYANVGDAAVAIVGGAAAAVGLIAAAPEIVAAAAAVGIAMGVIGLFRALQQN